MRWLVDGYNVIRRAPELASRERESLEAGRRALCALLSDVARASHDTFTVVFDGVESGGTAGGGAGVTVVFSSARESADRVLAQMARAGGAVVSNDREVRRSAERAGAIVVTTDQFLSTIDAVRYATMDRAGAAPEAEKDEDDEPTRGPRKGNPRRLSKKDRAARRALGRLRPGPRSPSD
jgi:predicted RNA-binding protein with PIN domain